MDAIDENLRCNSINLPTIEFFELILGTLMVFVFLFFFFFLNRFWLSLLNNNIMEKTGENEERFVILFDKAIEAPEKTRYTFVYIGIRMVVDRLS